MKGRNYLWKSFFFEVVECSKFHIVSTPIFLLLKIITQVVDYRKPIGACICLRLLKLFREGNYSREITIRRNTVCSLDCQTTLPTYTVCYPTETFIESPFYNPLPLLFIVLGIYNFACEHKSTDVSIHSTIKES